MAWGNKTILFLYSERKFQSEIKNKIFVEWMFKMVGINYLYNKHKNKLSLQKSSKHKQIYN
jgi:hypothetical protein